MLHYKAHRKQIIHSDVINSRPFCTSTTSAGPEVFKLRQDKGRLSERDKDEAVRGFPDSISRDWTVLNKETSDESQGSTNQALEIRKRNLYFKGPKSKQKVLR